jgi:hypothetical protein
MSDEEKALSLVGPIKATYRELVEASQSYLVKGILLGELLNTAKEAVGHGNWAKWLKKHCSEISHSTANVYVKLAKHKEKFIDDEKAQANSQRAAIFGVEEDLSIREALERVNKADGGGLAAEKDKKREEREKKKAEREAKRKAEEAEKRAALQRQDLAVVLEDKAPDEVLDAIGDDKEKKVELLKQQLKYQSPSTVSNVLAEVWDVDLLKMLGDEIAAHVRRKAATPSTVIRPRSMQAEARA